jgi:hypothetical protein
MRPDENSPSGTAVAIEERLTLRREAARQANTVKIANGTANDSELFFAARSLAF